jgi:hypothetical protein
VRFRSFAMTHRVATCTPTSTFHHAAKVVESASVGADPNRRVIVSRSRPRRSVREHQAQRRSSAVRTSPVVEPMICSFVPGQSTNIRSPAICVWRIVGETRFSHAVNTPPSKRRCLRMTAESRIGPSFGGLSLHESCSLVFDVLGSLFIRDIATIGKLIAQTASRTPHTQVYAEQSHAA